MKNMDRLVGCHADAEMMARLPCGDSNLRLVASGIVLSRAMGEIAGSK